MELYTAEEKLIASAQKGDLDAFEMLVNSYQSRVVTTAWQLTGDETEADDVSQEVWIRVFRSLPKFRFQSQFSTWLYRITVNQALTTLRRRKSQPGRRLGDVELDASEEEYPLASGEAGPRRILEGKEMESGFRKALSKLPQRQQLAVTLVLLQGLSHREAGEVIGIAEKTVSWHLFKARERLLEDMKDVL